MNSKRPTHNTTISFLALIALVVMSALLSSCTVLGNCGREREYCIDDDCACGKSCNGDEYCDDDDMCAFYARMPEHGVCVTPEYAQKHGVAGFANNSTNNTNNTTNNSTNNATSPTNNTTSPTNNTNGAACAVGDDCDSGLCCEDDGTCVDSASDCPGDLACTSGDDSAQCVGACVDDTNCAQGFRCDASQCVKRTAGDACDSADDCPDALECVEDGIDACAEPCATTMCSSGFTCVAKPVYDDSSVVEVCVAAGDLDMCTTSDDCQSNEVCGIPFDSDDRVCILEDGLAAGSACSSDSECANRLCLGGNCAELCDQGGGMCVITQSCDAVTHGRTDGIKSFRACVTP